MCLLLCFFFNDTATTEIYTLALHDALPIYAVFRRLRAAVYARPRVGVLFRASRSHVDRDARRLVPAGAKATLVVRSEEHTSELQSRQYLVCRLLLEKKKNYLDMHVRAQHCK